MTKVRKGPKCVRIKVTMADEEGKRHVIGHFDYDKAVQFNAAPGQTFLSDLTAGPRSTPGREPASSPGERLSAGCWTSRA